MGKEIVKIGVIGVGGMGSAHCKTIKNIEETELVFVCDIEKEVAKARGEEFGVPYFTDYREAVKSGLADAVIVATPHWIHPEIAIYAFKNGLHVLSEKPIAVTVTDADKMIKAAKKNKKVFAVMYQRRTEPWVRKLKELILKDKVIGEIKRILCIDPWYRAQAYYDSGTWRATWKGEGGGVLINQAPHTIDIFMTVAGLPVKVEAKTRTKLHKIEVEDEVCAFLEYKNGAWGYYYTTTCEPGGTFRMDIAGEKGKIIVNGTSITLYKYNMPVSKFTYKAKSMWKSLEVKEEKIELDTNVPVGHGEIIKNFARTILKEENLISPGEEGIKSVEFINACILSGKTGKPVKIPLNRKEYDNLMKQLIAKSKVKKAVKVQRVTDPKFAK
ncbi:MAG: Gfo/Idh/MocA family oxidoreductase [Candidatus Omnitrophica bacterium]|nr:Gfo/Idh/MocA family oxidoreductase [Candidatus Omnitrophota bacterium]